MTREERMGIAVLLFYMAGSVCFLIGSGLSLYAAIAKATTA